MATVGRPHKNEVKELAEITSSRHVSTSPLATKFRLRGSLTAYMRVFIDHYLAVFVSGVRSTVYACQIKHFS